MADCILNVEDINVYYGAIHAIKDVSFRVFDGEIHRGVSRQAEGGVRAMADCILNVEDINVYYGAIHAIKDVSFRVFDGEIVALIGANGAGKSTTLKTVSGLLRSNTGSIEFMGEDIMRTPADKLVSRGLAHVPEGRRVFAQMTVEENLEMGERRRQVHYAEDRLRPFALQHRFY